MRKVVMIEEYPLVQIVMKELLESIYPGAQIEIFDNVEMVSLSQSFQCDTVVFDLYGSEETQLAEIGQLCGKFHHASKIFFTGLESTAIAKLVEDNQGCLVSRVRPYRSIVDQICSFDKTNESDLGSKETRNEFQSYIRYPGSEKPLTLKQVEVMDLCIKGMSGKEIAREMGLSPETVRAHLKQCYSRLNAKTRAQAVSNFAIAKRISSRLFAEDEA